MIKKIYIMWIQGFDKAPEIVKICIDSWKYYNPDWDIVFLDDKNLINYIKLDDYIIDIYNKPIKKCHLSDIIRTILLKLYGGLWVDSTTFCNKPLNNWLPEYIKEGFFAFDKPDPDRLISNWLLYSDKNNYIIDKWCNSTLKYYTENDEAHTYFIHHHLFGELYNSDNTFKKIWDKVPKLSANGFGPHYLQEKGLFKKLSNQNKLDIDNKITPLYKLTHKCNFPEYDININLYYLYSTIKNIKKDINNNVSKINKITLPKDFNPSIYRSLYKDLSKLNDNQLKNHYITYGFKEKRLYKKTLPNDFNPTIYRSLYEDLSKLNDDQLKYHYLRYGIKEKRLYKQT